MVPEQVSNLAIGSRIDVSGHKGTVRYIGEVVKTEKEWLGIDWDDPERGKHDGSHEGVRYFNTWHPKSGSFIRPSKVTTGISCTEAIKKRYGLVNETNAGVDIDSIADIQREINAKFFQVVGAEKLNKRQSEFKNLEVVLLRDQPISGAGPPLELVSLCPNITELDLSSTLLSSWTTVAEIVGQLKRLKVLNLSDNRMLIVDNLDVNSFITIEHLVLGRVKYSWDEVLRCCHVVLNVKILQVPFNDMNCLRKPPESMFQRLTLLDLEGNPLRVWSEVNKLGDMATLEVLNLTGCSLESVHLPLNTEGDVTTSLFPKLQQLFLNDNLISSWESISELDKLRSFQDLKFRGNPVLATENVETNRQLITVRIKQLKFLNGLQILPEERRGAEFDFLRRHGIEWLAIVTNEDRDKFNNLYPCYKRLVAKWGPPEESELKKMPTSLKSHLIQLDICSPDRKVTKKIPYNMSVQKLIGLIQRLFNTGNKVPRLYYTSSKRENIEVFLDNEMKDLNFYSIENGDKILVRW